MGWESNNVFQVLIIQGSAGSGVFVYSPSPAFGNLVGSIAATGGTDPFGNAYAPGFASYLPASLIGSSIVAGEFHFLSTPALGTAWATGPKLTQGGATMNLVPGAGGQVNVNGGLLDALNGVLVQGGLTADTEAISSGQAAGLLQTVTNTTGGATGSLVRWLVQALGDVWLGCRVSGDTVNRITLTVTAAGLPQISFGAGGSTAPDTFVNRNASGDLVINPLRFAQVQAALALNNTAAPTALAGSTQVFSDSSGKLAQQPPSGTIMQIPGAGLATFPATSVTSAAFATLGTATIPANDAEAGSCYELEVEGTFTQATTTAVTLSLAVALGGTTDSNQTIAATYAPAGGTGRFRARVRAYCVTTGAAGTWRTSILAEVCQNATPGSVVILDSTFTTLLTKDTTVAETLVLQAKQGAITNNPNIVNREQIFKRVA